ncbi:DinB family protein [Ekhidna sp.]|uniref:DinB family protein n=1 Tax=Ekhidna sp. TaxID=2608089 RepID=UPI003BAD91CC
MNNKTIYKDAPEYCGYYFDLIQSDDLFSEFEKSKELTLNVFELISPELENYSYLSNKWTIKEVFRHIIDMERIFAYRAFRFSRFDETELSGVEENDYIEKVKQTDVKLSDLQEEYLAVRNSTIWIYRNIKPEMLDFKGTANKQPYTARTLGFAMIGHNIHHCNFIKTKYLNQ